MVDDIIKDHVVAYSRRLDAIEIVVLVGRFMRRMPVQASDALWSGGVFADHTVRGMRNGRLVDALTGIGVEACENAIPLNRALAGLPVAVFHAER